MIRLIQRRLIIPRGDTGSFSIPALKPNTDNVAVFTIFDCLTQTRLFQKIISGESDVLNVAFTHNETVNLKPGKYLWDIKYYNNPQFVDDELVGGEEVDSYYAGYVLPVCEIRETADNYLVSPDAPTATLSPEQLDIITGAINSLNEAIEKTQENVEHYPEIRDEVWYVWDAELGDFVSTGVRANGIVGNGIESAVLNDDYTLTLNFTDGTSFTSPSIRGETGNGIDDIVLNNDFTLTISYTDGESYTTPSIRGPVGATPQFTIGTVQEGASAAASITGTAENPVLNLTLPNANVPTRVSQLENDAGYLTDVQINNTSITQDGVADIPIAAKGTFGVVKSQTGEGILISSGILKLSTPLSTDIKGGENAKKALVPYNQHESTFYGLAKAAGDTTQSQSSNAVGAYTNEAKAAIQTMLDVPSNADVVAKQDTLTFDNAPTANSTNPVTSGGVYNAITNINTMKIHICAQNEYNSETGIPTIQNPDTQTFYLVPGGEGNNLFIEWAYVNSAWERFGSADVEVPVQDVQVNGSSILDAQGVANVPIASTTVLGAITAGTGLSVTSAGAVGVVTASNDTLKTGTDRNIYVDARRAYAAAFYGLAKAAGDSTQSVSDNAVGTYTDDAKAAIQQMLDVPSTNDIPVESGTGVGSVKTKDFTIEGTTYSNIANGMAAFAEGSVTNATNFGAHAEGGYTSAFGAYSHSEGNNVIAMGNSSHAEGRGAVNAVCQVSNTENDKQYLIKVNSSASVDYTPYILHTIITVDRINYGFITQVEKINNDNNEYLITVNKSIGNGYNKNNCILYFAYAMGIGSHKEGAITAAIADYQHVQGTWNVIDIEKQYADIVGNGTNIDARSNAYALTWTGDGKYAGDVYVHANADSSGGTKLATVNDIPEVPVQDVRVNGKSVLDAQGVANVPLASNSVFGAVRVSSSYGTQIYGSSNSRSIGVILATDSQIKAGTAIYATIPPSRIGNSTFYGLAKAAGADMKDIANTTVGTYPDAQKEAIQSMLGISQMLAPTNSNLVASQAYAIGDVLAANGHLYKATAAIAQDEAIIPDTNCVETTMAEAGGKIKDVQVAGSSVVGSDGIANIPIANASSTGTVLIDGNRGLKIEANGRIIIDGTDATQSKGGWNYWKVITPAYQHQATFYGLSKAAGVDLRNETVEFGTYPETSKTAIRSMIGAAGTNIIAIQDETPTDPDTKIWLPETAGTSVEVPTVAEMNAALASKLDTADAGLKVVRLI